MITEKKIGIWLPVVLAAGTLATMILLDRRRRRAPIFEADDVECGEGTYLSQRGCVPCPKWAKYGRKSLGRAIPPACTLKTPSQNWEAPSHDAANQDEIDRIKAEKTKLKLKRNGNKL
jgi:hypothetical protein